MVPEITFVFETDRNFKTNKDDELPVGSPELEELDSTEVLDINRSATDSRPSEPTPSAYTPNDSQAFFPSSPVENTPSPTVQDSALEVSFKSGLSGRILTYKFRLWQQKSLLKLLKLKNLESKKKF